MEHGCIWETQDGAAEGPKVGIPVLIMSDLMRFGMDAAVELDDELQRLAVKIQHETVQRGLATKFQSFEPASPHRCPESLLRGSHRLPEIASPVPSIENAFQLIP
jgi:hypothetical protein